MLLFKASLMQNKKKEMNKERPTPLSYLDNAIA